MANSSSPGASLDMDPFHQSFTLLLADGTPFNITLTDLNSFNLYNVRLSINCGSQIGASLLLLVVLALITQPDKRRSLIFIVNFLALLFNLIRSLLQSLYAASGFSVVYAYFSGNFSRVSASDYGSSVAADIFTLLVLICIETSLVIQIEIVCATMRNTYRQAVIAGSIVVALIAIGFRTALISENIKSVLKAENFASWKWLASATNITTTISICIFCAIFAAKLGVAMHERKKLRLRQFGPMRILFIMGCQTMFVPAVFALLQYFTDTPELGTNVLTLVAIFLPLSSTWAAASSLGQKSRVKDPESQHELVGSGSSDSKGLSRAGK